MKFGIDRFLEDPILRQPLTGKRIALLAHPASIDRELNHSLDRIHALRDFRLTAAFGPQHGLKGDKQDNMIETEDELDPHYGIPIFSLYGEVRRPTASMMDSFDVILIDLQDLGCRIYTFITTLRYILEAAATYNKSVWVLDRPNPIGRPAEGTLLEPEWESFVGAGPLPMRHGLTLGELGSWFISTLKLDVDYRVIAMEGWSPDDAPGFGWPEGDRCWINPSPNAPNLNMARVYPGTVMLEGSTLSEGRGTTRPLELFGSGDINFNEVLSVMQSLSPQWLEGCKLRNCWFEPTFHKWQGKLCSAIQVHAERPFYDHNAFKPWRLQALAFKAIRSIDPSYLLWRNFPYEYELNRLAIDLINGGTYLREWVDDHEAEPGDLEAHTKPQEAQWLDERRPFLLY